MKLFLVVLSLALGGQIARAQDIPAASAGAHLNENSSVVGRVVGVSAKTGPVFLNFDKPYPHHVFTAFVPASKVDAAGGLPFLLSLKGKSVRVTGRIVAHDGHPEIVVSAKAQIELVDSAGATPATGARPGTLVNSSVGTAADATAVTPVANTQSYWLTTSSGKRHNGKCKHFQQTQGRACSATDGEPCADCGG